MAQWLNYPVPGTPRTRDGKANLTAKAPHAANGKPDLSGVWQTQYAPPGQIDQLFGPALGRFAVPGDDPRVFSKYYLNILIDFKTSQSPLTPESERLTAQNRTSDRNNPPSRCLPQSIPRADLFNGFPFKIIQTAGEIVVLYEADGTYRQIYTDGRSLPVDPLPTWMGYSTGRWIGDTLVVETAGFNDRGWLDSYGHPRSEEMKLEERFRRRDFGHMDVEITVNDPKLYTRPFTVKETEMLLPDSDILESVCNENERDFAHLP
jgi:hypothetical protein